VDMSLSQMLEYLRKQKKSIQIGDIEVVTSVRNSYGMISKTLANSCESDGDQAPKFLAVQDNIEKEPRFPQVIFSRFLDKGIETLYASLCAKFPQLRIEKVTGATPTEKRNSIFNKYNQGSLDILLISNVGGVGLDLHSTTTMHLFECAENQQTESQAAHRVARFNSHKSLQLTTRPEVKIHRYISKFPDLNGSFPVAEIKDAEQLFSKYYGDLLTLRPSVSGRSKGVQGGQHHLLESHDEKTFTLKSILQQMKDQLPEPYSVEENMLRKNLQKEAEIAPFLQAFEKVAEQLVPF
jgi:superfamily II DNA/RNA helicase